MKVAILGTRGVPAQHGGFETFAEYLALYLVERNWDVTVYCQVDDQDCVVSEDTWRGVTRVMIPVSKEGALGTMQFDWRSIRHVIASEQHKLVLTLGYNTATFCLPYRTKGIVNIINMDGLEWKRDKWKPHERAWLWLNERCGCLIGNHLVADHPEIANHLATRVGRHKITTIPYGAPFVTEAQLTHLDTYGVNPNKFAVVIARAEPENSVLEIVRAFSSKRREEKLVVLGKYDIVNNDFHREVVQSASADVLFVGAIYDKSIVEALRFYASFYVHGHRVGGTNPSLVEALGVGSAVLAHDNHFNRWVAGDGAVYFSSETECAAQIEKLFSDTRLLDSLKESSRKRFQEAFTWGKVLGEYESLLEKALDSNGL